MEIILGIATILGGIAALVYFVEKATRAKRAKTLAARQSAAILEVRPSPVDWRQRLQPSPQIPGEAVES